MASRLGIGITALAWAVAACSGEVGSGDRSAPVQGQSGAGSPGVGSIGESDGNGGAGGSGGNGGSRPMGTSGTSSMGRAGAGGAGGAVSSGDGRQAGTITATDADLQFCVDENNRYRATVSSQPLSRSSTLEAFAATGAQVDYAARTAHSHFATSKGIPGSKASGENEIPGFGGWNLQKYKTVHDVIAGGLLDMWNEGPGGGHYENMKSTKFTQLGCGVFVAANGDVTVTMDYTN